MTHTYSISGMTCNGCAATVKKSLASVAHVEKVVIDLEAGKAEIAMDKLSSCALGLRLVAPVRASQSKLSG